MIKLEHVVLASPEQSELITGSASLRCAEIGKAAVSGISDSIGNVDPDIVDKVKETVLQKVNLEDIKKAVYADSGWR